MKYRKKPVVIEARHLVQPDIASIMEWCGSEVMSSLGGTGGSGGIYISTLEGSMLAQWGDWVIKGVEGEFYPCKPDIFAKTYEKVDGVEEGEPA